MLRSVLLVLVALLLVAGLLAGCGGMPAGEVQIVIENSSFAPNRIKVAPGTTVRWVQRDALAHTVTSDKGLFDSGQMAKGATFTHKFTDPGSYGYICTNHQFMRGAIIVE